MEFPSPKPPSDPPDQLMAPDHARVGGRELCTLRPLVPGWLALERRRVQMENIVIGGVSFLLPFHDQAQLPSPAIAEIRRRYAA